VRPRSCGCLGGGGFAVAILALALMAGHQATSSPVAAATVGGAGHTPAPPASMLAAFRAASEHHHVPLSLLLAVAAQESSFQADARSSAGALGVMQMLPGTFREYAPAGTPPEAIWEPSEEIDAAAADLAANGANAGDVSRALLAYNHDDAYVQRVEERQAAYQSWIDGGTHSGPQALPWPLRGPITQRFGCTGVSIEPARGDCPHFHTGLDIGAPDGTAVASTCAGPVTQAEDEAASFGIHVRVECDAPGVELSALYAHLAARVVHVGDRVEVGQLLGYEGSTGNSTGPHLHFEVDTPSGPVDPMGYLGL
jgi:murein DD-endopeptidase MepM/ murein hydrolase activator NlpD